MNGHTLTVADALAQARAAGVDRLDAHLLLGHVTGQGRTWLISHDEQPLPPAQAAQWADLLARRAAGEPCAYLLGEREFHGLRLQVSPAVLVPRPDTETLVDWALALLAQGWPPGQAGARTPRVLDLGTGSGAIALAVAAARPDAEVHAVDRSADALAVARANGRHLGLPVQWHLGSWLDALPAGTPPFDLVLSNPPYIAADDPHMAALAHEPREALVAADDGLADLAHLAGAARPWLQPGGWLLFEHGWTQSPAVAGLLASAGYAPVDTRLDLGGHVRCTGGRRP